ncbi:hypothetical protein ACFWUQ_09680 [Streptomyces sp. NPDC058662]|uniref:hypothetical protein n=1 Tax=Streptomyces sp. NPDC058662 TaxID=3346583 RepID=UPI0036602377
MGANDAADLRKLADDLRTLLNEPIEIAADRNAKADERWLGPTAEHVRGELATRKARLGTMAGELDKEAANRKDKATGNQPD